MSDSTEGPTHRGFVMAIDFKKTEKQFYLPPTTPERIMIPEMIFLMADGRGDPNTSPAYAAAIEALYGLTFTIKMGPKKGFVPDGYFEYVVPPLEGLWSLDDGGAFTGSGAAIRDKSQFVWTSMIRQPAFVTEEVLETAKEQLARKKPDLDLTKVCRVAFTEGLCAQVMHVGPYDDEPETIAKLSEFVVSSGFAEDMEGERRHHEIYLGDPRKMDPRKLRTVIRHPIREVLANEKKG